MNGIERRWIVFTLVAIVCFAVISFIVGHYTNPVQPTLNLVTAEKLQKNNEQVDKYWQNAKMEVDKSVPELFAQHQVELGKNIQFNKLIHGDPSRTEIAVTFDDGPHPSYTPKLLSILKQYNAKATFFLVGEMAERHPELVKAEIAAGHAIGNHTYHHVNLTKIPPEDVAVEIQSCGDVLKSITGKQPHLFRPPGGDYDRQVAQLANSLGYTMVLWTDDPGDYASPGAEVIEARLDRRINNGGIILIHDGIQQTIDELPAILKYLNNKGYKLVTIDEMIRDAHNLNPVPSDLLLKR